MGIFDQFLDVTRVRCGEIIAAACSEDPVGGALTPGRGRSGGASVFVGFPSPSPPNNRSIHRAGRDIGLLCSGYRMTDVSARSRRDTVLTVSV